MIYLLHFGLGLSPLLSNAGGYALGIVISFTLNQSWTFERKSTTRPLARYVIAFSISYVLNVIVLMSLIEVGALSESLSQLVAVIAYSIAFFLLCRTYVFAR